MSEQELKKKRNNRAIVSLMVRVGVVILFLIMAIVAALHHEHWQDEAQSFLLARDNSWAEIFHYIRYEGTPPLWVLIIKVFICLGGTCETFFILPLIFSTLAVVLFEFKVKCPLYVKILLPFTFFIFFQFTVVARSYSLVFLAFVLLMLVYRKRFVRPFIYSFVLLFMMSICTHTFVIAGSLYILYIFELLCKYIPLSRGENFLQYFYKKEKKVFWAIIAMFGFFVVIALLSLPVSDRGFVGTSQVIAPWSVILRATVGGNFPEWLEIVLTVCLIGGGIYYCKNYKRKENLELVIKGIILFVPYFLSMMLLYACYWHVGILTVYGFALLIISGRVWRQKKWAVGAILLVLGVQIVWTVDATVYDWNNNYSGIGKVADIIRQYDYKNLKIVKFGFYSNNVNMYLEGNIYTNTLDRTKGFYFWSRREREKIVEGAEAKDVDIYVVNDKEDDLGLDFRGYQKQRVEAGCYFKNFVFNIDGFSVYIKDELVKK